MRRDCKQIKTVGSSPVTVNGVFVNEIQLTKLKTTAHAAITISVSDDLVDLVFENDEPADVWQVLERNLQSGDQGQIILLSQQLHLLKRMKGVSITNYIQKAGKLKNKLLGESVPDKTMASIVLNGLPRSYKGVIQGSAALKELPSFEKSKAYLQVEGITRNLITSSNTSAECSCRTT